MISDYKGHSIIVQRVSYGANGNHGKIQWSVDYKGQPTVFDDVVGFKTVKMIMYELERAVDDGLIGCDHDDRADNAFERAAGVVSTDVRMIDKPVLICLVIILTVTTFIYMAVM